MIPKTTLELLNNCQGVGSIGKNEAGWKPIHHVSGGSNGRKEKLVTLKDNKFLLIGLNNMH